MFGEGGRGLSLTSELDLERGVRVFQKGSESFPERCVEEESIQGEGYQMSKGAAIGGMEGAGNVPQGQGSQVGVAQEATSTPGFWRQS